MEESLAVSKTNPRPRIGSRLSSLLAGLRDNPVILKELRARMRGNRAFVLLTIYLLVMVVVLSLVYVAFTASQSYRTSSFMSLIQARQEIGKTIFWFVIGIELFAVCVFTPSLTSSGITSEREQQTFDLLRTTLLSARALVYGKFLAGFGFVLLMLLTSLPLQSLAFLFGGIAPEELLVNGLVLVCTAASFSAMGVLCSCMFQTTRMANGVAYGAPLIYVVLLPAFLIIMLSIFGMSVFSSSTALSDSQQILFQTLLWLSISLNPIATIITTDLIITEYHSVLLFQMPVSSGGPIMMLSPWILYCVLALLVTVVLLAWSAHLVQRTDT